MKLAILFTALILGGTAHAKTENANDQARQPAQADISDYESKHAVEAAKILEKIGVATVCSAGGGPDEMAHSLNQKLEKMKSRPNLKSSTFKVTTHLSTAATDQSGFAYLCMTVTLQ